ncbi:hypothetical protein ACP0F6_26125, partial [Escherichia coli]|uniref:hypothetical protein n=1 Tax=Escherichia coli TaxID=562 RepID=UPI003CE9FD19
GGVKMNKVVYKVSGLWNETSFVNLFIATNEKEVLSAIILWAQFSGAKVVDLSIEYYSSVH